LKNTDTNGTLIQTSNSLIQFFGNNFTLAKNELMGSEKQHLVSIPQTVLPIKIASFSSLSPNTGRANKHNRAAKGGN
jgi:hypothetical protein